MRRQQIQPRPNWQQIVESQGLTYHTLDDVPYWDESVYYQFSAAEIDQLEAATYELDRLCLAAAQYVIDHDLWERFLIPPEYRDFISQSWEQDERTLYGRFDLAFDGQAEPKLLEYNADTPTALLEAAVVQWFWLQDCALQAQQFNSIHERLLEAFQSLRETSSERFYFAAVAGSSEDYMTVNYLRDVALQAGFDTAYLNVEDIGWHAARSVFTDQNERAIRSCFKLYPWEWLLREQFGPCLLRGRCLWFEPPWKSLLSNKAILPLLWELNPGNPYLLAASYEPLAHGTYIKKSILGREGANVQVFQQGRLLLETPGPYDGPAVYQEIQPLPRFDERYYPIVGSWVVNGWSCGIGIREDANPITGNLSRFVPHIFQ